VREPRSALLGQYQALLSTEGLEVTFTEEAVREMARFAMEVNQSTENIGARRPATLLETVLDDLSFEGPEKGKRSVRIDGEEVRRRLAPLARDQDLSRLILYRRTARPPAARHPPTGDQPQAVAAGRQAGGRLRRSARDHGRRPPRGGGRRDPARR